MPAAMWTAAKRRFTKRCANCHQLEGAGHAVGPDLAPLTHRPAEYLLTAILDPNRAVEDRYVEYVALTTDGRQLTGILLEETGASLTLAAPEGKQVVLPRGELEQLKSSGKSLMPEGIERDVPPAEMTDILAYLRADGAAAEAARAESAGGGAAVQRWLDSTVCEQLPGVWSDDQDGGDVSGPRLVEQPGRSLCVVVRCAGRARRRLSRDAGILVRR